MELHSVVHRAREGSGEDLPVACGAPLIAGGRLEPRLPTRAR